MIRSLLKWPGGKSRVIPELLPHLPKAGCLVEPFVGGASVFLNTDYRTYILADINRDLINLYRVATNHTELFIDTAKDVFKDGNSVERYAFIRDSFNRDVKQMTQVYFILRAAWFLYLNRHGYNGMCRYNRQGGYNIPFGSYRNIYFPEIEIRQFAEKANDTKAVFLCASFERTLDLMTNKDAVIYCDPPYVPESETANFTQYHTEPFTLDHHRQLVRSLRDINRKYGNQVVISNSDTAATREIYSPFNLYGISVQRSIGAAAESRSKAGEVIGVLNVCKARWW